jgi:hypothetical protein
VVIGLAGLATFFGGESIAGVAALLERCWSPAEGGARSELSTDRDVSPAGFAAPDTADTGLVGTVAPPVSGMACPIRCDPAGDGAVGNVAVGDVAAEEVAGEGFVGLVVPGGSVVPVAGLGEPVDAEEPELVWTASSTFETRLDTKLSTSATRELPDPAAAASEPVEELLEL